MKPLSLFSIIFCIFFAAFVTAAQDDLATIERIDGVRLHIESFTYQDTAGSYTPANDVYLVMLMTIDNDSANDVCIVASDIRLQYADEEYPPERALMSAVQSEMDVRRDYVGPLGGHCVEAGATELSFAAFDVPAGMESFGIRFDEIVQQFDDLEAVGTPMPRPTAAPTTTTRPTTVRPTSTPATISSEETDAATLTDGLFILAGGRDVRTVQVVDGRDNGGERVAIIGFIISETSTQGLSDEIIDILRAVAATIRADDLDLDSILLVLGDASGNSIGTAATYVDDLLDYHNGRISRDVYFEMILFTPL